MKDISKYSSRMPKTHKTMFLLVFDRFSYFFRRKSRTDKKLWQRLSFELNFHEIRSGRSEIESLVGTHLVDPVDSNKQDAQEEDHHDYAAIRERKQCVNT
jgi:hypothetical protein